MPLCTKIWALYMQRYIKKCFTLHPIGDPHMETQCQDSPFPSNYVRRCSSNEGYESRTLSCYQSKKLKNNHATEWKSNPQPSYFQLGAVPLCLDGSKVRGAYRATSEVMSYNLQLLYLDFFSFDLS